MNEPKEEAMAPMWSPLAQRVVSQLIADLPEEPTSDLVSHARRLNALPIGWSMWAGYLLRANGEVVVVGEDFDLPDLETIYVEPAKVLGVLVWGTERYPELRQLLPVRGPGTVDCRCRTIPVFAEGKVICWECGGLGWVSKAGS